MAAKLIEVEANPRTDRDITLNSRQIQPWWLSFFAITAVQNTLTTSQSSIWFFFFFSIANESWGLVRCTGMADMESGETEWEIYDVCGLSTAPFTKSHAGDCGIGGCVHSLCACDVYCECNKKQCNVSNSRHGVFYCYIYTLCLETDGCAVRHW